MVGRLKSGVSSEQARSDAERVAQEIMCNYPASMASLHISAVVIPLQEATVGQARPLVRILFFAVAVVLLIACVNFAVLLVVLGIYSVVAFSVASRMQEMAIRMALGAPRTRVMRLILVSGLKLAAIGCVIGLLGTAAASGLLRSFLFGVSPFDPLANDISTHRDSASCTYCIGASCKTGRCHRSYAGTAFGVSKFNRGYCYKVRNAITVVLGSGAFEGSSISSFPSDW
jgi:ABC-type antimicrobial peptide transport system permease subunit